MPFSNLIQFTSRRIIPETRQLKYMPVPMPFKSCAQLNSIIADIFMASKYPESLLRWCIGHNYQLLVFLDCWTMFALFFFFFVFVFFYHFWFCRTILYFLIYAGSRLNCLNTSSAFYLVMTSFCQHVKCGDAK